MSNAAAALWLFAQRDYQSDAESRAGAQVTQDLIAHLCNHSDALLDLAAKLELADWLDYGDVPSLETRMQWASDVLAAIDAAWFAINAETSNGFYPSKSTRRAILATSEAMLELIMDVDTVKGAWNSLAGEIQRYIHDLGGAE